jgi:hypothetical protein
VVTHGFDHTALSASTPDTIASAISGGWGGAAGPLKATNFFTFYTYVRCHILMQRGANLMEGNVNVNLVGTQGAAAPPPPQVACIVRKRTALAGIQFRGRMFWPAMFISEGNINELGIWTGANVTTYQTAFTAALNQLTAAQTPMVLLHSAPKPPHVLPSPTLVTSLEFESMAATQRRRLR